MPDKSRVDFANTLRGFAAICVVISHYYGVFWLNRAAVASLINAPILSSETHAFPSYLYWLHSFTFFNWGPYGVALFFLISGFVIPFSLKKLTWTSFFVNRFFRIVPTYIIGFSITLLAIWVSTQYFATHWELSLREVLIHYVPGLRDLLISRSIDGIIWTLEIEIKFYLLSTIFIIWFRQESRKVFLIPVTLFLLSILLSHMPCKFALINRMVVYYQFSAHYLIFMFIGVSFNYLFNRKLSRAKAMLLIGVLFALFCILWQAGPYQEGFSAAWGYGFALLTFTVAYNNPTLFASNRVFDFFANISYPLYVIHGVTGYVALRIMLNLEIKTWVALLIVTISVLGLAWLLHKFIEMPSQQLGKKLSKPTLSVASQSTPCLLSHN